MVHSWGRGARGVTSARSKVTPIEDPEQPSWGATNAVSEFRVPRLKSWNTRD